MIGLCKVCEIEDFRDPELRAVMREAFDHETVRFGDDFPDLHEYRKYWEVAMAVHTLRSLGAAHADAEILGVGAGNEATCFVLTREVRRVFATDLYLSAGWEESANSSMLTDPHRHWPDDWNDRRLVVQHMNALDLKYEDGSMDGVFSSSSIEHFGSYEDIGRSMDEVCRVLKPGGIATISTEFRLGGPAPGFEGAVLFDGDDILEHVVGSRPWELVSELRTEVSPATLATEQDFAEAGADQLRQTAELGGHFTFRIEYQRYPHLVLRYKDHLFTSVHVALRKRG